METLPDYIAARLTIPFAWGGQDCMGFALGWLSVVAGRDLLAPYRPWHDQRSAQRAIKKAGGLVTWFDANLTRIPPALARDGDVALVSKTAYLFSGSQLVGPGKNGLIFISRMEAECAWHY